MKRKEFKGITAQWEESPDGAAQLTLTLEPGKIATSLASSDIVAQPAGAEVGAAATHTPDYSYCVIGGQEFNFTPTQRAIVRALWTGHRRGNRWMSKAQIADGAGMHDVKMWEVFKRHKAWGRVILSSDSDDEGDASQDCYRLKLD